MSDYTIRCGSHKYITLEHEGRFIFCLDNDCMKAEEMIYKVERRTGKKFSDIRIKGQKEDFNGLSFFNGGWHRDFWEEFPSQEELESYMNLKRGMVKC